jgi:hypothetical protein
MSSDSEKQIAPIVYSVKSAVAATRGAISRTRMFELLKTGQIDARRIGRRTVIMADSLHAYFKNQPSISA